MNDPNKQSEEQALHQRLARLSSDLAKQREISDKPVAQESENGLSSNGIGGAMSLGFRVLSEFVAGILVGAFMGWQTDLWLGTSPLFLLVFLTLGTAAGFWNVYRIASPQKGSKR